MQVVPKIVVVYSKNSGGFYSASSRFQQTDYYILRTNFFKKSSELESKPEKYSISP